ncbi:cupin domain-containing protein [Yinghuangia sp. ASG 101]|uniref:cupin domain-containing protein n=1 Tax=Yinghuangia sp. ASG 101 TaxID=2896848 RepID=UPI001E52CF02|nr:cupin domain-containing protein [Yinghuangia sp. ASG 101]UGQ12983.1 cupin domain-containing protein [Yinghuangia sp. ASG 101]
MPETTPTPEPRAFPVRRVVTGHDAGGRPVIASDGAPEVDAMSRRGYGTAELLWFDAPPVRAGDGGDPGPEARGAFPAPGGAACRIITWPASPPRTPVADTWLRVPGDSPDEPGMHRTDTQDLVVVLSGAIVLGLDDGDHELGPGDALVQRGTRHRWRVVGDRPCVFLCVVLAPEVGVESRESVIDEPEERPGGHRLLITGAGTRETGDDRSRVTVFGTPRPVFPPADVTVHDLWLTGGPLADPAQGGTSIPGARWSLAPRDGGVAVRRVAFAPGREPDPADWHTTATIDVGVVVSGSFALDLARDEDDDQATTTRLDAGDVVVQRATRHRLRPVGDTEAVMVSVMFGLRA